MTLLEIVVSMMIISILLAVVIPNLGPMRLKGQLRTASRNVAALIRYARVEAIYRHRPVKVRIDTESAQYRVDLMLEGRPARERDGEELELVEEVRDLPDRVFFEEVTVYGGERVRRGVVVLDFLPSGTVTPATIVFSDGKGQRMTLDVFGTTGAVEIYSGEPVEREVTEDAG